MKYFYLTIGIVLLLLLAFSQIKVPFPEVPHYTIYTLENPFKIFNEKQHLQQYQRTLNNIEAKQIEFARTYEKADSNERKKIIAQAKSFIFQAITQKITPFWNETEWDFNGTTETPRKGQIACGYFVSTILLHAGIDLDKYYLSRASSSTMIKHLCRNEDIITIYKNDFQKFLNYIQEQPDGIYLVGLEKHVGMLAKQGNELYFIHSRKPRTAGVIQEKVRSSKSLRKSKIYVVGNLLENETLIKNWLKNKRKSI